MFSLQKISRYKSLLRPIYSHSYDDVMILFLQISYTVDPSLSSQYHAHADGSLLVLLDVTPSQEMVDEGIAREVINKIQKLRKKVRVTCTVGGTSYTNTILNARCTCTCTCTCIGTCTCMYVYV